MRYWELLSLKPICCHNLTLTSQSKPKSYLAGSQRLKSAWFQKIASKIRARAPKAISITSSSLFCRWLKYHSTTTSTGHTAVWTRCPQNKNKEFYASKVQSDKSPKASTSSSRSHSSSRFKTKTTLIYSCKVVLARRPPKNPKLSRTSNPSKFHRLSRKAAV